MTGYDYISKFFEKYGVSHVFYQEAVLRVLMREIEKKGDKAATKFILAHSEQAAGCMADGYARASGKPGVCMCQSIGAGNMVGAIYDAWLANTPLVCVTAKKTPVYQYKNSYQETDHRLLYEAVTKFNGEAIEGEQIPFLFRNCFQQATTGKARPTHIDITDHQGHVAEMAEVGTDTGFEPVYGNYPAYRPTAPKEAVEEAVKALKAAKKPLLIAGRGATYSGAGEELVALATKIDAPIVTSPDGKGLMDETDPLWSGIVGNYGMDCANRSAANADLCVFIGTQTADQTTLDWQCPPKSTKCIQIDIDASELGKNYTDTIGLPGDAKAVLTQLLEAAPEMKHADWRKEVAGYVKATLDEYDERINRVEESGLVRQERLCSEIMKAVPDDAVIVADTGYSAQWSATMMRTKKTQKYFRAAGSLGWAFPASLGAKCACPDKEVICFAGDGAMFYYLPEMETAHRYGIKTITIVNNNNALGQSASGLTVVNKEMPDKGARHFRFTAPSFSQLAKTFGLNAIEVHSPEEIGPAIKAAMAAKEGTVIEVHTIEQNFCAPAFRK